MFRRIPRAASCGAVERTKPPTASTPTMRRYSSSLTRATSDSPATTPALRHARSTAPTASHARGSETSKPSVMSSTWTSTPSRSSAEAIAAPIPDRPPVTRALRGRNRRLDELLAQRGLAELADRRLRDLRHELDAIGQPPLRELRRDELAQLLRRGARAFPQHYRGQRPLRPLLVRDRDHRGLRDGWVRHQRILELDRGDPLAAGLDHVLRAVLDHHEAARVHRDDVARPEPAVVGPAVRLLGRVVVGGRDPWAADLELAHRLTVPRSKAAFEVPHAQLDERERDALHRDVVEPRLVVGLGELTRKHRDRRNGRRLRHPPAVHYVHPVPLLEAGDHRARRRRAADEHPLHARQIPLAGIRVEQLEDPKPDRGHARGPGHALLHEGVEQRLW